mmetsp:Transcript_11279/g.22163  ORF Transcript_11279/g.22163 Transcript_11279/m.22163 type:complete len:146 (+) Transcript_11279:87-524(+)
MMVTRIKPVVFLDHSCHHRHLQSSTPAPAVKVVVVLVRAQEEEESMVIARMMILMLLIIMMLVAMVLVEHPKVILVGLIMMASGLMTWLTPASVLEDSENNDNRNNENNKNNNHATSQGGACDVENDNEPGAVSLRKKDKKKIGI